eukprot:gene4018-20185_t
MSMTVFIIQVQHRNRFVSSNPRCCPVNDKENLPSYMMFGWQLTINMDGFSQQTVPAWQDWDLPAVI